MDSDTERRLAESLMRRLSEDAETEDAGAFTEPELREELEVLAEIDRALAPPAELPARLSGHRIIREIGSGGMGVVLLAMDEGLGREVAIKTLSPRWADNPVLKARFMREARAMAQMNHPSIARIYSLGPADEPPHFVMEYIEGAPLTEAAKPLTFHQKAELMRKVVLAAAFLHEHGVIHRDLKPANVLVGTDLEPKLLDFGLALEADARRRRLSQAGEVVGTPEYLSPEQTRGGALDARSDIFALGVLLYELLAGAVPFEADTTEELVRRIRVEDPVLPSRRAEGVPKGLQNICLKALEKDPARRYASAREMAADLVRFLGGEAVLAEPHAYSRLIADQIGRHLTDLDGWRRDQIISDAEYDGLRRRYARLTDREDAWIMEARRLTLPQVSLYLGVWVLSVGAALLTLFRYPHFAGAPAVLTALAAAIPTACIGIHHWKGGRFRVALAFLLAFCLLLPIALLVTLGECGIAAAFTQGRADLELFSTLNIARQTTNAQLWWSLLLLLPAALWLRRFTRASVFTLVFATAAALWCLSGLLRMGMLEWLEKDRGRFYFHLIPFAAAFMAIGYALERRGRLDDSRYFYPFGVAFTWAALTGIAAFHKPYADWLRAAAPWTRGQVEYLFILNAGIYLLLDRICELLSAPQVKLAGKAFRFVMPGHVLTSLFLLGLSAFDRWQAAGQNTAFRLEARTFEWLLPAVACVFVFGSVPRQMKNFFATGLLFLAIGVVRLQQDVFKDQAVWPLLLLVAGLALMLAASNYAPLRIGLNRLLAGNFRRH